MAKMAEPTSHAFESQRLRLHYVDWGNHDAPPLLLVHGNRDHCRSWDWVAEELRGRWHVIALDLRGHGDSQWSPEGNYAATAHVFDLAHLIEDRKLAPVSIIAHSLGAAIVLRYAGVFPEKLTKIVAIEGLGPKSAKAAANTSTPSRVRNWIEAKAVALARPARYFGSVAEANARVRELHPRLTQEQVAHLAAHAVRANSDGTVSWKFDPLVRVTLPFDMPRGDADGIWANISCPVQLVYGEGSHWAANPLESGAVNHFKDARVTAVPNAGHWLHHEQFGAFMGTCRSFL